MQDLSYQSQSCPDAHPLPQGPRAQGQLQQPGGWSPGVSVPKGEGQVPSGQGGHEALQQGQGGHAQGGQQSLRVLRGGGLQHLPPGHNQQ